MGAHAVRRHSLWLEQALGRERATPTPAAEGRLTADICIVGGGYTGLWTAIRVLEADPGASALILEGDLCGAGASGRNGGFALTWWPKIETLIKRTGEEDAFRLARLSEQALNELDAFCDRERMEAQFRRGGWLWTATSAAQREAWAGAVELCARRDEHPFVPVSPEELRERTGSPAHYGGVFERSAATIHPALLVRGLRRVALERGARVFERSPVRALDRDRGELRTPGGSVRADTVVLATNAWAAQVRELRRAIVPLSSDVVATAPMAERLAASGWTGGESISDSRLMVRYYRTTEDGRVVFGRGGGALGFAGRFGERFDYDAERARRVQADLCEVVPAAREIPITHAWAGAVDRSPDGLPLFGRLPARGCRLLYGVGFSGNGVLPSVIAGPILGSTALEHDDQWSRSPLNAAISSRFPPEPARFVGGVLVREAVRRKEAREQRGLPVDRLTRRVAALAPSGYFKVSEGTGDGKEPAGSERGTTSVGQERQGAHPSAPGGG